MAIERRFETGFRETETDEPGLVLGEDGIVYLVAADGTRSAVGTGGSLPSQWTVDASGNLYMLVSPETVGGHPSIAGIVIQTTDENGTQDCLVIAKENGDALFGIDPFGYVAAGGASLTATDDVTVLRVDGNVNTVHDVAQFRSDLAGGFFFRLTASGAILCPFLPTADPVVAGQLWNSAGTLKVSAG